jgi:hypothetical protein
MSRLSIYLLRDPETHTPKYVGVTKNMKIIRNNHPSRWGYRRNPELAQWLRSLVQRKLKPEIQFITYADSVDVEWRRKMIIKTLAAMKAQLFNSRHDEAKRRQSLRMMELWKEYQYRKNNMAGRQKSQDEFLKMYQDKLKAIPSVSSSQVPPK